MTTTLTTPTAATDTSDEPTRPAKTWDRISGPRAGLLAGAVLALTPVAALMFRFNNPDAVMVLLMTAAAYCTVRALQQVGVKWLAMAGVALGFAFLAKMLEGLMVAPALAAAAEQRLAAGVALGHPGGHGRRGGPARRHRAGWGGRGHSDISNWVTATFPSTTVGDATVYNLSSPKSAPGS